MLQWSRTLLQAHPHFGINIVSVICEKRLLGFTAAISIVGILHWGIKKLYFIRGIHLGCLFQRKKWKGSLWKSVVTLSLKLQAGQSLLLLVRRTPSAPEGGQTLKSQMAMLGLSPDCILIFLHACGKLVATLNIFQYLKHYQSNPPSNMVSSG